jgi:hypothetical protein
VLSPTRRARSLAECERLLDEFEADVYDRVGDQR